MSRAFRIGIILAVISCSLGAPTSRAAPARQTAPAIWFAPDPAAIAPLLANPADWEAARAALSAWCVPYWWLGDDSPITDRFVRGTFLPALQAWNIRLCLDVGLGSWWDAGHLSGGRGEDLAGLERGWWDQIRRIAADGYSIDYARAVLPISHALFETPDRASPPISEITKSAAASLQMARQIAPGAQLGVVEAVINRDGDRWSLVADVQRFRLGLRGALGRDPDFIQFLLVEPDDLLGAAATRPREVVLAQQFLRAAGVGSGVAIGELNAPGTPRADESSGPWHDRAYAELLQPYWAASYAPGVLVIGAPGIRARLLPESDSTTLTNFVAAAADLFQADAGPSVSLRDAPPFGFPMIAGRAADSNSPSHWDGDTFYLFNSVNRPWRSSGPDLQSLGEPRRVDLDVPPTEGDRWLEATFRDDSGALYGWYHQEVYGMCPPETNRFDVRLTAPKIGAMKSTDNGAHWKDLGVVIEAPGRLRCDTRNRYTAGGVGDFSVMLDSERRYVYLFFSSFADEPGEQGVGIARMPFGNRDAPVGNVSKWHRGDWQQPGLGGRMTSLFPALVDWHRADANGFWGPSIHWNSYLETYVVLLNRAANGDWLQDGAYASFNGDLAEPTSWTAPRKFRAGGDWYAQVVGTDTSRRETDKLAGRVARYFEKGVSSQEIVFERRESANAQAAGR